MSQYRTQPDLVPVGKSLELIEAAERHRRSSKRLGIHTYVATGKCKNGVAYFINKFASDTGKFMGTHMIARGIDRHIKEKGTILNAQDFKLKDFDCMVGLPGWTLASEQKTKATMVEVEYSNSPRQRKPRPQAVKPMTDAEVKRHEKAAAQKKATKKKEPKKVEKQARGTATVHNEVKIYPAHKATLKAVIDRDGAHNKFNLDAVVSYHEEDGYEIARNWCRRTLLELCNAGILTRTPERGFYVVSKEGLKFAATL